MQSTSARSPLIAESSADIRALPTYSTAHMSGDDDQLKYITLDEAYALVGTGQAQLRILIVCGLCFMSDAIEIGLLSFLQVSAADEFGLSVSMSRHGGLTITTVPRCLSAFRPGDNQKRYCIYYQSTEEASLSSAVFAGQLVGAIVSGPLADRCRAKRARAGRYRARSPLTVFSRAVPYPDMADAESRSQEPLS